MTDERTEDALRALEPLAVDDFSKRVIHGAARVLEDRDDLLRLNLFAMASRMLLEHLMGTLAPRVEVEACWWYKAPADTDGPTRAQRIRYCFRGGLSDASVHDELGLDPKPLEAELVRAYAALSKHVHGRAETVIEDGAVQDREAATIVTAVGNFLAGYRDARSVLLEPLAESLDSSAVDALLSETILNVDELANHHSVEDAYMHETRVEAISPTSIRYKATGSVDVCCNGAPIRICAMVTAQRANRAFPSSARSRCRSRRRTTSTTLRLSGTSTRAPGATCSARIKTTNVSAQPDRNSITRI